MANGMLARLLFRGKMSVGKSTDDMSKKSSSVDELRAPRQVSVDSLETSLKESESVTKLNKKSFLSYDEPSQSVPNYSHMANYTYGPASFTPEHRLTAIISDTFGSREPELLSGSSTELPSPLSTNSISNAKPSYLQHESIVSSSDIMSVNNADNSISAVGSLPNESQRSRFLLFKQSPKKNSSVVKFFSRGDKTVKKDISKQSSSYRNKSSIEDHLVLDPSPSLKFIGTSVLGSSVTSDYTHPNIMFESLADSSAQIKDSYDHSELNFMTAPNTIPTSRGILNGNTDAIHSDFIISDATKSHKPSLNSNYYLGKSTTISNKRANIQTSSLSESVEDSNLAATEITSSDSIPDVTILSDSNIDIVGNKFKEASTVVIADIISNENKAGEAIIQITEKEKTHESAPDTDTDIVKDSNETHISKDSEVKETDKEPNFYTMVEFGPGRPKVFLRNISSEHTSRSFANLPTKESSASIESKNDISMSQIETKDIPLVTEAKLKPSISEQTIVPQRPTPVEYINKPTVLKDSTMKKTIANRSKRPSKLGTLSPRRPPPLPPNIDLESQSKTWSGPTGHKNRRRSSAAASVNIRNFHNRQLSNSSAGINNTGSRVQSTTSIPMSLYGVGNKGSALSLTKQALGDSPVLHSGRSSTYNMRQHTSYSASIGGTVISDPYLNTSILDLSGPVGKALMILKRLRANFETNSRTNIANSKSESSSTREVYVSTMSGSSGLGRTSVGQNSVVKAQSETVVHFEKNISPLTLSDIDFLMDVITSGSQQRRVNTPEVDKSQFGLDDETKAFVRDLLQLPANMTQHGPTYSRQSSNGSNDHHVGHHFEAQSNEIIKSTIVTSRSFQSEFAFKIGTLSPMVGRKTHSIAHGTFGHNYNHQYGHRNTLDHHENEERKPRRASFQGSLMEQRRRVSTISTTSNHRSQSGHLNQNKSSTSSLSNSSLLHQVQSSSSYIRKDSSTGSVLAPSGSTGRIQSETSLAIKESSIKSLSTKKLSFTWSDSLASIERLQTTALRINTMYQEIQSNSRYQINSYLSLWYHTWNFDMFHFAELTGGHPLFFSAMYLIDQKRLLENLPIERDVFEQWLLQIESAYLPNLYHNSMHAADVLHAMNYLLLDEESLSDNMLLLEVFGSIISAICHDVDHPGYNNSFLVKSHHPLAILYSDTSVLEFHHCAYLFHTTLNGEFNIFSKFSNDDYDDLRRTIIRLVIATDMGKHFEYVNRFNGRLQTATGLSNLESPENRLMVMEMAIKCADLANPTKTFPLSREWTEAVSEEFFQQGDKEKELGLPISQFMDRHNQNQAKCQLGFIDVLVLPLYESWRMFSDTEKCAGITQSIARNRAIWANKIEIAPVSPHKEPEKQDFEKFEDTEYAEMSDNQIVPEQTGSRESLGNVENIPVSIRNSVT